MTNDDFLEIDEKKKPLYLRHYTNRSSLLKILKTMSLRLGNPEKWEDRNDFASVAAYKRKTGAEEIRVLCFAHGLEVVHHWNTYAKKDGCCIMLKSNKIINYLEKSGCFLHREMKYYSREDLTAKKLRVLETEKIPFIKRHPYECEKEYRVIWTGKKSEQPPSIPIKDCIEYITLSPSFKKDDGEKLSDFLYKTYSIKTNNSRILESKDWISLFNNLK